MNCFSEDTLGEGLGTGGKRARRGGNLLVSMAPGGHAEDASCWPAAGEGPGEEQRDTCHLFWKWGCWESLESAGEHTFTLPRWEDFLVIHQEPALIHMVVFPTLQAVSHESETDPDITNPTWPVQRRHWHPQLLSVLSYNNSHMSLYTQPLHCSASLKNTIK